MRNPAVLITIFVWIVGAPAIAASSAKLHQTELTSIKVEQVLSGLSHPWGIAMLPDGHIIVTERSGAMYVIDPENPKLNRRIRGVPRVFARGQGGLLDVAVDPNFEQNRTIYFTYSEPGPGGVAGLSGEYQSQRSPPRSQTFGSGL